jgi:hypothetical protein
MQNMYIVIEVGAYPVPPSRSLALNDFLFFTHARDRLWGAPRARLVIGFSHARAGRPAFAEQPDCMHDDGKCAARQH